MAIAINHLGMIVPVSQIRSVDATATLNKRFDLIDNSDGSWSIATSYYIILRYYMHKYNVELLESMHENNAAVLASMHKNEALPDSRIDARVWDKRYWKDVMFAKGSIELPLDPEVALISENEKFINVLSENDLRIVKSFLENIGRYNLRKKKYEDELIEYSRNESTALTSGQIYEGKMPEGLSQEETDQHSRFIKSFKNFIQKLNKESKEEKTIEECLATLGHKLSDTALDLVVEQISLFSENNKVFQEIKKEMYT